MRPVIFLIGLGFTVYLFYAYISGFFQYTEPGVFTSTAVWIAMAIGYTNTGAIGKVIFLLAFLIGVGLMFYGLVGDD